MCALRIPAVDVDPTKTKTPTEICADYIDSDIQRIQGLIINSQIKYNETIHKLRNEFDNYDYSLVDIDYDRYGVVEELLSIHFIYATEYAELLAGHIAELSTILSDWLLIRVDAVNHHKTFQSFIIEFPIKMLNRETTMDHLYEYQREYSDKVDVLIKRIHEIYNKVIYKLSVE